jgi:hypothetical protein
MRLARGGSTSSGIFEVASGLLEDLVLVREANLSCAPTRYCLNHRIR